MLRVSSPALPFVGLFAVLAAFGCVNTDSNGGLPSGVDHPNVAAKNDGGADPSDVDGVSPSPVRDAQRDEHDVDAAGAPADPCVNPALYFAIFGDGESDACTPISGKDGKWLPEPLFTDAPPDVQAITCAYRWVSTTVAPPDARALADVVGWSNGLAPACGPHSAPEVGKLRAIDRVRVPGGVGSVGCDVCGVIRGQKLWAILPPSKILVRQFAVILDSGTQRAFEIEVPDSRALSLTLPAPLSGTTYKSGRTAIY